MKYNKEDVLLFACIEKNIGDDLFIQTICNRYPNRKFVISNKAKYGSLVNIPNIRFSRELELWLFLDSISITKPVKKLVVSILKTILKLIIGKHDVGVYIVGNAFKNTNYESPAQIRWLKERVKLSTDFYILSTNFGPYNDERWKNDAVEVFKQVKDICFRDIQSYTLFSFLPNVRYAPDAILSLGKKKKAILQKRVLISIIDCSFASRGEWLKKLAPIYEEKMIEIVNYFSGLDYEVTLINSNTDQDGPASTRILNACHSNNVNIFNYNGNIEELNELYESAECVIGTRLHTIILAWLYGIPVYPIVYDIKVENMLKSYSYEGRYTNISNIESLNISTLFNALFYDFVGVSDNIFNEANNQFLALDERLNHE